MKLVEWADLKDLYIASRRQPNKLIFRRDSLWTLRPLWGAVTITIALLIMDFVSLNYQWLMPYTSFATLLWVFAMYKTRIATLRQAFPREFAEHAIDRQSPLNKEHILGYALFLKAMRAEGYTVAKLNALSNYAELIGRPAKPGLMQNLGFASFLGVMIALSTEAIKSMPWFTPATSWVVLMLGAMGLFLYWLVLDGIHSVAHERAWIKRYLDRAAQDL